MKPPDVLVLGAGGTLGEAWLSGFLAGARQQGGIDFRQSPHFVGTSAGSIVAARLAAGRLPRRPGEATGPARQAPPDSMSPARTAFERQAQFPPDSSLSVLGVALRAARSARALARAAFLAQVPQGRIPLDELRARIAALGPRFDGRLLVVAVDAKTGHRVVFGAPGAPEADVPDAVAASCAVPGLFRPVRIGGRDYVDGGVWGPVIAIIRPPFRVPYSSQKSPPSGSRATTFAGPPSASQLLALSLRLVISAVHKLKVALYRSFSIEPLS